MKPKERDTSELKEGKLLPLLLKFAWPAVITMTLNQLYNIIDRVYIGQGCGKDAIAGLTLTFPIMGALAAIGVLIGMGSSAVLSIRLGANDRAGAERALGQCVALKVLFGLICPPLMYFFGFEPILRLMAEGGTTDAAMALATQYLKITIFFNIFAHLGFGLSATMRAEGSPKESMLCMLVGCVTNLILDPVFIFESIHIPGTSLAIPGLGMKVAGAAWATNISMMATCATALWFYLTKRSVVRLRLRRIWVYRDITPQALSIGLSPCLMQMLGAFISFSLNRAFSYWSPTPEIGTIEVSALGIANTISFVFHIPTFGIQQGIAPIIGFNWGAGDYKRVRETLVLGLKLTAVATFLTFLGTELLARPFARCFASAEEAAVVNASTKALRVANIMIWSIFINVAATTYFQAVSRPKTAIILSLLRQCVCLLPTVWILPHFMDDKIAAIWLALPISDIVSQIATVPPLMKELKMLRTRALEQKTA